MGSLAPTLERYDMLGRLASGGMGDVWLARAQGPAGFEKLVVLKTLRRGAASTQSTEMLLREARIAAMLSHPNCVQVFELGEQDGEYFIVMEFIDGMSLARVIRRGEALGRPMPVAVAARIAIDAASGLDYAHTLHDREGKPLGLVHRDVSLDNILVTFTGQTKLVDFGIAKVVGALADSTTQSGVIKGKVGYMAPEYLRGGPFQATADLFALGVVLYRMLTGKRPFEGETDAQVLVHVLEATPAPIRTLREDVPEPFAAAVERALAKDPVHRFPSAKAMRAALAASVPEQTDVEVVAAHMAALWPAEDPDRVALRGPLPGQPTSFEAHTESEPLTGYPTVRSGSNEDRQAAPTRVEAVPVETRRMRITRWGLVLGAVAVVGSGLALALGGRGRASPKPAIPDGPVRMLIADVRNDTGEPLFDGAIENTIAMALEEAPSIVAYPRARARGVLRELAGSAARLDDSAAHKVAVHERVYGVVSCSIAKADGGFAIEVRAADASGTPIAQASAHAASKDAVLSAVADLAIPLRRAMGDATAPDVQRADIAKLVPHSLEAAHLYAEARGLLDDLDPQAASRDLQRVLELDPDFDAAYATLAGTYINSGATDKAREAFRRALARIDRMSDRQRFVTRGMFYATQGEPNKAVEVYEHMLERFPDDRIALSHLAQTYAILNQFGKALDTARRILEHDPNDLRVRGNSIEYAVSSGDFQFAERAARELVVLQPDNPAPRFGQAAALYFLGRTADAVTVLHEIERMPGGASPATSFLAEVALGGGHTAETIALVDPAIATDLEQHDPLGAVIMLMTSAHAHLQRGETAAAIAACDRAVDISEDPNVTVEIARIYVAAGAVDKAAAIAKQLAGHVEDVERGYAKIIEGDLALRAGRTSDAIQLLTAAHQLIDTWVGTFDLGLAYLSAGAYPQAQDAFSTCLQRRGELSGYVSNLQPVWYYLGRAQEGLKSPVAADSYRAYVASRASADADLLLDDARRRLAALAPSP